MKMRMLFAALGVSALAATNASALAAPPATDARWSAWYGCWRPEAIEGVAPPEHVICVLPTTGEGVSIATIANGRIVSEQPIVADGSRRATDNGGCKGFESATWSKDGRRVFLKSDLNCGGDVQRVSTGVLALISAGSYVDVQTVEVGGEKASRTVRYIALADSDVPSIVADRIGSEPLARESARLRAAAPLDLEDVVEATRIAGGQTVESLLVARKAGFKLDAATLRTLVASGVEPSTVDVMVALSYPEHFAVAEESPRAAEDRERNPWRGDDGIARGGYGSRCYDAWGMERSTGYGFGYDPYASRYSRCGYNSFYSPYGYDPYGWGYGNGRVVVISGGSVDPKEEANGALVKGKGYTRRGASSGAARPRSEPTTQRTGSTTGSSTTRSKGSTGSTATVRSGGSTGSSSGGSSAAPARTAKPKGGGQ